jgi:hypothetical protein
MKRTDLAKNQFLKVNGKISRSDATGRPGGENGAAPDRREQRKRDQALGLVPFAVKLDGDLVKQLQALAQSRQLGLNEVVAELLKKGLDGA